MSISPKYRKDFKDSDFSNPRIKKEIAQKQKRRLRFWGVLVSLFVFGLIYLLFFSPVFKLISIEVVGLDKIRPENFNQIVDNYRYDRSWLIFPHNNFWLFNKEAFAAKVGIKYYFGELIVKKKWPNQLVIVLVEKESAIKWLSNNLCYNLDLTGMAVGYCEDNRGILAIRDLKESVLKIGDQAIEPSELQKIIDLDKAIQQMRADRFNILYYEKEGSSLTLTTEEGPLIKFNLNFSPQEQARRLALLLDQEIKEEFIRLNYIDLRFGEKVYYQ